MAYLKTGLWLLAMAIIFGAFGAHGLQALATPERLETWDTAVRYQALMSLFLIAIAGMSFQISDWVYRFVVAGLVVFSGSLYLLVLFDIPLLGAITPIGGILMITGIVTAAMTCRTRD
mgnify:FL=1|tara:strand:+ start:704 stop:1057 length:354 start_codon:yes stop_codon:yes gene_type:complete